MGLGAAPPINTIEDPHEKICLQCAVFRSTGSVQESYSINDPQAMQNKSSVPDSAPQAMQTPLDKAPVNKIPCVRLPRGPLGPGQRSSGWASVGAADVFKSESPAPGASATASASSGSAGLIGAGANRGSVDIRRSSFSGASVSADGFSATSTSLCCSAGDKSVKAVRAL